MHGLLDVGRRHPRGLLRTLQEGDAVGRGDQRGHVVPAVVVEVAHRRALAHAQEKGNGQDVERCLPLQAGTILPRVAASRLADSEMVSGRESQVRPPLASGGF